MALPWRGTVLKVLYLPTCILSTNGRFRPLSRTVGCHPAKRGFRSSNSREFANGSLCIATNHPHPLLQKHALTKRLHCQHQNRSTLAHGRTCDHRLLVSYSSHNSGGAGVHFNCIPNNRRSLGWTVTSNDITMHSVAGLSQVISVATRVRALAWNAVNE